MSKLGKTATAGALGLALLALVTVKNDDGALNGPDNPNALPECDKPAPNSCYSPPTTLVGTVPAVPSSTAAPVPDETATNAPNTTTARPSSEAAPQTTVMEPVIVTDAPTTTAVGVDTSACKRTVTVRAGDSWVSIADRQDVWTRDLLALNHATRDTALVVGAVLCSPPSVYGDAPAASSAPTTAATTVAPSLAPQAPPTSATTTTTLPATTTQPKQTTPRRPPTTKPTVPPTPAPTSAPKQGQDAPKIGQQAPKGPPMQTTAPPCATC